MQDQQPPPNLPKPWMHDLWAHLHNEHGLTLLESEIHEIVRLAAPGWHPIETAPKDGTRIIGKLRDSDVPHSVYYKARCGWRISWDDHDLSKHDEPTHWMPLPTPPQV